MRGSQQARCRRLPRGTTMWMPSPAPSVSGAAPAGTGHPWIAVESLYSMDGDRARRLWNLPHSQKSTMAFLVIERGHATGVFGPGGRGFSAALEGGRENVVVAAYLAARRWASPARCSAPAESFLRLSRQPRPRLHLFDAPSPLDGSRRFARRCGSPRRNRSAGRNSRALSALANAALAAMLGIEGSGSQILPVMIGDNARAVRIAARLRTDGFDIRAIRPPTVPEGTARLRIAITLNVDRPAIGICWNA